MKNSLIFSSILVSSAIFWLKITNQDALFNFILSLGFTAILFAVFFMIFNFLREDKISWVTALIRLMIFQALAISLFILLKDVSIKGVPNVLMYTEIVVAFGLSWFIYKAEWFKYYTKY